MPATKQECPPGRTLTPPLGLVVVSRIELETAEGFQNALLLAPLDVFSQRCRNSIFFGSMIARFAGCFDQFVVQCEVGCHMCKVSHIIMCNKVGLILGVVGHTNHTRVVGASIFVPHRDVISELPVRCFRAQLPPWNWGASASRLRDIARI